MLLVLEIILTITAWKKGWRWWALLPLGIAFGTAFLAGMVVGAENGNIKNPGAFVFLDLLLIVTQIVLTAIPKSSKTQNSVNLNGEAENYQTEARLDYYLPAVVPDKH